LKNYQVTRFDLVLIYSISAGAGNKTIILAKRCSVTPLKCLCFVAGAVHTCWREVCEVMMQSQWRVGRLGIQIEIRAFCKKKIGYMTAGWIGHYRFWDVAQYYDMYDAFIWMGYVGFHTRIKCRSLKPDSLNDS
jgi:hypothetical protein